MRDRLGGQLVCSQGQPTAQEKRKKFSMQAAASRVLIPATRQPAGLLGQS